MRGSEFHGEVVSADASGAGVAFALYLGGMTAAYTLGSKEFLNITDVEILTEDAITAGIFADSDANGKRVTKLFSPANGGKNNSLITPHICPAGVTPKLITSGAGNVVSIIHGFITGA